MLILQGSLVLDFINFVIYLVSNKSVLIAEFPTSSCGGPCKSKPLYIVANEDACVKGEEKQRVIGKKGKKESFVSLHR